MKIDENAVKRLSLLSSIELSDADISALRGDLGKIVDYIGELSDLDTTGVEPTYQVTGLKNVWRDDVVEPQIAREKLLELAPEQANNSVKVPKVL